VFPEPRAWQLVVKEVEDLTPRMRRIALSASTLDRFSYLPGQDASLAFTAADGSTVRRRYTIRSFDPEQRSFAINVVMHGNGPGMRWASAVWPGTEIEAIAPRGKITLAANAPWHLFAGDATAVPAAFAMMEALPPEIPALGIFAIDNADERQPLPARGARHGVVWQYAGEPSHLLAALERAQLPEGRGHAYLAGEVALVSALKQGLIERGWAADQISAKAYWNRGRANAGHGEPEQKVA
jgi:NADPH-dependent ferric siderophore reductase